MRLSQETIQSSAVSCERSPRSPLGQQVSQDLTAALAQFKDPRIGLRQLSRRMGIHSRTLKRLLHCEHSPGYVTLYKIYRVTTGAPDDTELLSRVPALIREHLVRGNPKRQTPGVVFRGDLEREVLKDPVFAGLYFAAGSGTLRKTDVLSLYGQYGLRALDKMLALRVLTESAPERYELGDARINLTSKGIHRACTALLETFVKPELTDERAENHMAVFAEGLSQEAYVEWLRIDEEAFRRKIELSRRPGALGPVRAFTIHVTEKFRFSRRNAAEETYS